MSARRVARSFLLSILMLIPAGLRADDPVDVVDVLRQAIEAYESGDRVAALAGIRRAYRTSSHGVHTDADGRVSSLGALRVDYHPFSARIRQLGTIRIDYEAFSERPRRIGDIELRWVFDELRAIAGVDVR